MPAGLTSFRSCSYIPGYDTHGLPLELKALSALKQPASSLTPQVIRAAARKEAEKGIATQGEEFRSFCGIGAFDDGDAYKTMNWQYERRQLQVVREMVRKGEHNLAGTLHVSADDRAQHFRFHHKSSQANAVLSFVQNSSCGSRTRVPRGSQVPLCLCRFPSD